MDDNKDMLFPRLRSHMRWAFIVVAILFAAGFIIAGIR